MAEEEHNLPAAREWNLRALAIFEQLGDTHGAARIYHQMVWVAQEERGFKAARDWCFKALVIFEQLDDLHSAACVYGQLRMLAGLQRNMQTCVAELARSTRDFIETNDPEGAKRNTTNFLVFHRRAAPEDRQKMEAGWHKAGLAPFPPPSEQ